MKRVLRVALVGMLCLSLCGCGWNNAFGRLGAQRNSYDVEGEQVKLELIERPEPEVFVAPIVAALAPALIGLAIDTVKSELDKEATRYEAQYSAAAIAGDFWEWDPDNARLMATYGGCRLTRTTSNGDALALDFEFEQADKSGDLPFLLVKLKKVNLQRSKAKVWGDSDSLQLALHLVQNAQWVDEDGAVQQKDVSIIDYPISVQFGKPVTPNVTVGTLVAVPSVRLTAKENNTEPSAPATAPVAAAESAAESALAPTGAEADARANEAGNQPKLTGSITKLTLTVTEVDPSGAPQHIERFSKVVGDNRDDLVKAIVAQLGIQAQKSGGGGGAGGGGGE